jgi:O-antigen ligase
MIRESAETTVTFADKKSGCLIFTLICGYLFLYIERPWEVWTWLAPYRIERMYMILALGIFALWRGKQIRWGLHPLFVIVFLLLHYALAPFAFSPAEALLQGFEYFKLSVLYFLMIWSIKSELELRRLVQAYIAIMGFYMLHSLKEYIAGRHVYRMGITRMIGVDQFLSDPNSFGASLVISLPFLFLLFGIDHRAVFRTMYVAYGALAIACMVLTGSRSAFVAFLLFLLLDQFRRKGRKKYLMLIALVLLGLLGWQFVPEEKRLRFETIWNPEVGPANAEQSAEGRIEGFKAGMRMLADKPFTGVGAGGKNFVQYRVAYDDGAPNPAHNLAGELFGTMGLLGGIAFCCQIIIVWRMAGKAKAMYPRLDRPSALFLPELCIACRQSLILLLCSGLFGHNLYRANWLWIGAWSFLCLRIAGKQTPIMLDPDTSVDPRLSAALRSPQTL